MSRMAAKIILKIIKFSHIDKYLSDEAYLNLFFIVMTNKRLNLTSPKTFNEKLQWLKINNRKIIYTRMVDKFAVKKYVSDIIGKEYIIPTLGVWDKFEDINFDELPNEFVLKCTHDSGGLVICEDKNSFNRAEAKNRIKISLNHNYYWSGREWPYKNVAPKIIAEKYIIDEDLLELRDYKFFCFNGIVKCFKVDFDRFTDHHANYFSPDGDLMDFGELVCTPVYDKVIEMPKNLRTMIKLAEKLSYGTPFMRVDFYDVNNKVYFGEITFYPASGFGMFTHPKWDNKLGEWLDIEEVNVGNI